MRKLMLIYAIALISTIGATARSETFYVSPHGDDTWSGRNPAMPFQSLARASKAAKTCTSRCSILVLGGLYLLAAPLTIEEIGHPQSWMRIGQDPAVLDGGGTTAAGIVISAHDVVLQGFVVRNMSADGILIRHAGNVVIRDNIVTEIHSSAWSQGAIHVSELAPNITISRNTISGTDYSGIEFDASAQGDLRHIRILSNTISDTCRKISDCAAIYVLGRSPSSNGAEVVGNIIKDFGLAPLSAAIYLDDGLSYARVLHNSIVGRGSQAFHIHGGSFNHLNCNYFAPSGGTRFVLYQGLPNHSEMKGNEMRGNVISPETANASFDVDLIQQTSLPFLEGNRWGLQFLAMAKRKYC